MKNRLKKYFPIVLFVLLLILGFTIICYPLISNRIATHRQKEVIAKYKKVAINKEKSITSLIEEAKTYNEKLTSSTITDVFTFPPEESSKEYLSILNTGKDGVMGYISIPKIDEEIPIYHGTSTKTLQKGVGHLEGSSFPVGGKDTHAVLSAHRGLPSAKLFTDLDQLKKGDEFYIHILDETLAYQVDEVSIIEPSETEKLTLQEGYDYITLVTCHPYAINTHRLLVRGVRVPYHEENVKKLSVAVRSGLSDIVCDIGLLLALAIIISVIIVSIKLNFESNNRQEKEVEVI